jgi:tetratricopeptide (TPR) repeat protein
MASEADIPGGKGPDQEAARLSETPRAPGPSAPAFPPSKPLQIFLLIAFVISGAAYLADQWTESTVSELQAEHSNKVRHLSQRQGGFEAHLRAGDEAFARKHFDQAAAEYRAALPGRNQAEGHEKLGRVLIEQGNPDEAFAQFKEAIQLDPKRTEVYHLWGGALIAEGKPEEAARLFKRALQNNATVGSLHFDLAAALREQERNAEAVRRAAAASGKASEAEAAEEETRRLAADALSHYGEAGRLGVNSADFWCSFGELLNEQGKFGEAESCLVRAVKLDSSLARAHSELALAKTRLGNYAEGIEHYEKVLALIHDDPATLNSLALLYATATNSDVLSPKMAVQLATRACDATTSQNARYMDTLARSYAADRDFLQAISWEDKALRRAGQLGDRELAGELEARYSLFLAHKTE